MLRVSKFEKVNYDLGMNVFIFIESSFTVYIEKL